MVQYCFTSTETTLGRKAQVGHLDSHTAPELSMTVSLLLMIVFIYSYSPPLLDLSGSVLFPLRINTQGS